jgi:hypothetical protein
MMDQGPVATKITIEDVNAEIDLLTAQQTNALQMATFLGMTPEEAKEYDNRRSRITRLVKQLAMLTKAE